MSTTLTAATVPAAAAQAAQVKTADRIVNRAPKGGAWSTVTSRWYAGGTFMPMLTAEQIAVASSPAPLVGSSRQLPWAARLRSAELSRIELAVAAMRAALDVARRARAAEIRREIKALATEGWRLANERSAAAIIERHRARVAG